MGSCVSKNSNLKGQTEEIPLPAPIKRDNKHELMVKFREHQNNNRDDNKSTRIYRMSYLSRDFDSHAFDFSDDICETILSYLPIEDKLNFECVSKQWQRLIYNRVHILEYPLTKKWFYPDFDEHKRLLISRKFLKKCHFIQQLKVWPVLDTDIVAMFVKNCYHLKSIDLRLDKLKPVRRDILCKFTENCGHTLQRIRFHELNDQEFDSESGLSLLIVYSEYMLNVRSVSISIDSDNCLKYFTLFADIFNERINELEMRLKFSTSYTQLRETFEQISRFTQLNSISLKLESVSKLELDLRIGADLLAKGCPKLNTVSLEIREQIHCSNEELLKSLNSFSSIHTLNVKIRSKNVVLGSFESLITFWRLSALNIMCEHLSDEHMTDIHINCPNLKSIELKTMERLSDKALYSLAKLTQLINIKIYGIPYSVYDITDSGVCQLITNCQKLRNIHFECGICLTQLTLLTLNALADSSPKYRFRFSYYWQRTEQQSQSFHPWRRISAHEIWPELECLPENLTITSGEYFVGKCGTMKMSAIDKYRKQFTWIGNHDSGRDGRPPQCYTNGQTRHPSL